MILMIYIYTGLLIAGVFYSVYGDLFNKSVTLHRVHRRRQKYLLLIILGSLIESLSMTAIIYLKYNIDNETYSLYYIYYFVACHDILYVLFIFIIMFSMYVRKRNNNYF